MPMHINERDKMYLPIFLLSLGFLFVAVYWFGYPFFEYYGLTLGFVDETLGKFAASGKLDYSFTVKLWTLVLIVLTVAVRANLPTKVTWPHIWITLGLGLGLFFWPFRYAPFYIAGTIAGYFLLVNAIGLLGRKIRGMKDPTNDPLETFEQCGEKIENDYSVNFETRYQWKGKRHRGWVNMIQPQRAALIMGVPGSGKSFSVYNPIIAQTMQKSFTALCYDFKYPDLSEEIYNEYLLNVDNYKKRMDGKVPKFCVINFDDPRYSHRCNPLNPAYLTDTADASEVADIIMRNVNPQSVEKEDFFSLSAKVFIAGQIRYLSTFEDGRYCTFPHLIEFMSRNYEAVFEILQKHEELRVLIQPFQNALRGNAQEQLQGQIASAQIPLLRFASPALYWVLSGNDFTLDINSRDEPKIMCIGNNPDRQTIYGTTLALYTSRIFRQINHKGRHPCAVILDEFPTIFVPGIAETIATARSNKVCVFLGCQDESQIRKLYGDKEAEVIFNTVGNVFAGQVNGRTAKSLAETFGKEFREQESETRGGESETINRSFHQIEILPQSRIETLSQGYFFGKVADSNDCKMQKKLFCAEFMIDLKERERKMKARRKMPQADELTREYNRFMGLPEDTGVKGYFNDEAVKERVENDADRYIRDHVAERLREEERQKKHDDEHYTAYTVGSEDEAEEIERRLAMLSGENRRDLLKAIVKSEQKKAVDEVIKANFYKIKADIDSIFVKEGVPEFRPKPQKPGNWGQAVNGGKPSTGAAPKTGAPRADAEHPENANANAPLDLGSIDISSKPLSIDEMLG